MTPDDKPRWSTRKAPIPPAPPPKAPVPLPVSKYAVARQALSTFLDTAGDLNLDELVTAAKALPENERESFVLSIPTGSGRTAQKCAKAKEAVGRAFGR